MDKLCLIAFLFLYLGGCQTPTPAGAEGHGTSEGHHPGGDHFHGEVESYQTTLWNEDVELFAEYPPLVAGESADFVIHVTYLDRWRPKTAGGIDLILRMEAEPSIEIHEEAPARAGIYLPNLNFPKAGDWEIEVRVPLEEGVSVQLLSGLKVYGSQHDAEHGYVPAVEEETVAFLKEQQWRMPFTSERVREQTFREALAANGVITPRAGGRAVIHAPISGRLRASASPHLGAKVEKGQRLASLIPRLGPAEDAATLTLALQRAELADEFARKELERIRRLFRQEAVPEHRLHVARLEAAKAGADLAAAEKRVEQFSALQKAAGDLQKGRVDLFAPLSGTVLETHTVPGALVAEGERLFELVDLTTVWLTVHIPEADLGRITEAQGAWFKVEGLDRIFEVDLQSDGRLIGLGGKIDPIRRVVPLIFELPNPEALLRIGMFVRASVLTGNSAIGPSIPLSALTEEGGLPIAYVHLGGEQFARRILRLGLRDGGRVQVLAGLEAGERVVTRGTYQIRLAGAVTAVPAHGHEH